MLAGQGIVITSLYKYLKREHAESMLSEGSVKIGTLYEYWPMELHARAFAGSKTRWMRTPSCWWRSDSSGRKDDRFAPRYRD